MYKTKDEALSILRKLTRNPEAEFKQDQWEAIDAVVNQRKKVIVVQKTGWGKSAVYFISAKLNGGITLIISPLIALMRNQVAAARNAELRCETINSSSVEEWETIFEKLRTGNIDVLLISPERLANDDFVQNHLLPVVQRIGLLVVDEVHCISDWGHDFRPDYKRISRIINYLPSNTPLLGTTATANDRVIEDINDQFGSDSYVLQGELMRDSIHLDVVNIPEPENRLAWLLEALRRLPGTGIIYTLTKTEAEVITNWLKSNRVNADFYHGSVGDEARIERENLLINNEVKVLVSTSALGMGFDKPDVSFVIHYGVPSNIIAYYQQVGRAGRSIRNAYGILISGSKEDERVNRYFRNNAFPSEEIITLILETLESTGPLSVPGIQKFINFGQVKIQQALKYLSTLESPPVYKDGSKYYRTIHPYRPNREYIEQITRLREAEWIQMLEYTKTKKCKMQFLAQALNSVISDCGNCCSCKGHHLLDINLRQIDVANADEFIRHQYFPMESHKRRNIDAGLLHEQGWVLSRWGRPPYGDLVEEHKHGGYFEDVLIDPFIEMLRRKKILAEVKWVTSVPSNKHPHLVPDFARRVAERLQLPFIEAVSKVKDNEPQKLQNNEYHRKKNLEGVFAVTDDYLNTPVLLIDDVYDSGWTVSIISMLLLEKGVQKVFPATLTTAQNR